MKKIVAAAALTLIITASNMSSGEAATWTKRTVLTVHQTMQVPGMTLEPGKYVLKLMDSPANRHVVQIFNSTEQELITTILALPNERLEPTSDSVFEFWETPAGTPRALRAWFYPGDHYGQEFKYPKFKADELAGMTGQTVPVLTAEEEAELRGYQSQSSQEPAQIVPPAEAAPAETVVQSRESEPMPAPMPRTETEPAPVDTAAADIPAELPRTATTYPLIGLSGFLLLAFAAALRTAR
jgi:hypothetical protein